MLKICKCLRTLLYEIIHAYVREKLLNCCGQDSDDRETIKEENGKNAR